MKGTTVEFDDDPFFLIVDDTKTQSLKLTVLDDDFGWADKVLGVAKIPLENEPFITEAGTMDVVYDIYKEEKKPSTASRVGRL